MLILNYSMYLSNLKLVYELWHNRNCCYSVQHLKTPGKPHNAQVWIFKGTSMSCLPGLPGHFRVCLHPHSLPDWHGTGSHGLKIESEKHFLTFELTQRASSLLQTLSIPPPKPSTNCVVEDLCDFMTARQLTGFFIKNAEQFLKLLRCKRWKPMNWTSRLKNNLLVFKIFRPSWTFPPPRDTSCSFRRWKVARGSRTSGSPLRPLRKPGNENYIKPENK